MRRDSGNTRGVVGVVVEAEGGRLRAPNFDISNKRLNSTNSISNETKNLKFKLEFDPTSYRMYLLRLMANRSASRPFRDVNILLKVLVWLVQHVQSILTDSFSFVWIIGGMGRA